MKKTMGKMHAINLSGLTGRSSFQFYNRGKDDNFYSKEFIINEQNMGQIIKRFNITKNVKLNDSPEAIRFLNNSLKEYLKNIIQDLIEYHRRRTYSKYIPFKNQNKIISYGINVQRDPDPIINAKKNKFFAPKNLDLICTINTDKKLELLNKYNAVKNNKTYQNKEDDEEEKNDNNDVEKKEEDSESSECNFFQKEKRKDSDANKDNKKEHQGIMNVFQSHELTTNKKLGFKNNITSRIELKDLVNYLEDNQTVPMNKKLLFDAYTEMTIFGKK